jgi:hypothetical protein
MLDRWLGARMPLRRWVSVSVVLAAAIVAVLALFLGPSPEDVLLGIPMLLCGYTITGLAHEVAHVRQARRQDRGAVYMISVGRPGRGGLKVAPGIFIQFGWPRTWGDIRSSTNGVQAATTAAGYEKILVAGPRSDLRVFAVAVGVLTLALIGGSTVIVRPVTLLAAIAALCFGLNAAPFERADGYWIGELRTNFEGTLRRLRTSYPPQEVREDGEGRHDRARTHKPGGGAH